MPIVSSALFHSSINTQLPTRTLLYSTRINGHRNCKRVKYINHAQFVDDTLLLGGASTIIARKFKQQLDLYKEALGDK
jgi:hypothetical protein